MLENGLRFKIKSRKVTIEKIIYASILISIFLGMMNFENKFFYFVYIALGLFMLLPKDKLYISKSLLPLIIFAFSYLFFYNESITSITNIFRPFIYPIAYFLGTNIIYRKYNIQTYKNELIMVFFCVFFGGFVHFLLNFLINASSITRSTVDIWTNTILAATGQAAVACIAIGVSSALLFSNLGKLKRILGLIVLSVIIMYNLVLAGRTIMGLIAIGLVVAFSYRLYAYKTNRAKIFLGFLCFILLFVYCFTFDIMGIRSAFESSNLYIRFTTYMSYNDDPRIFRKYMYFLNIPDYLWGGNYLFEQFGYAHDLYFDSFDDAGICALISITCYILSTIYRLYKCIINSNLDFDVRLLYLCTFVVINIQFWLEPIIAGMPWLLTGYCFLDGILYSYLQKCRDLKNYSEVHNC